VRTATPATPASPSATRSRARPTPTALGSLLDEMGLRRLIVTGLAGDVCVAETALDGVQLGYEVVVPLAATRFVERKPGDSQRAVS